MTKGGYTIVMGKDISLVEDLEASDWSENAYCKLCHTRIIPRHRQ